MNIMQLKYAYEVARTTSLSKAAENLHVTQPNLSRQIKLLEKDIGTVLFERSSKGMLPTPEGIQFLFGAKSVIESFDALSDMYGAKTEKLRFSACVPRASYISSAFTSLTMLLDEKPAELRYREVNSAEALRLVIENRFDIGIVRYAAHHEYYFTEMFESEGLGAETVSEFLFTAIMSRNCRAAKQDELYYKDLTGLIEITYSDTYVPSLSYSEVMDGTFPTDSARKIYICERGCQLDMLSRNANTFMWGSPLTDDLLERYDLVQLPCADFRKTIKDVLIYRKNYAFSGLDNTFISLVKQNVAAFKGFETKS